MDHPVPDSIEWPCATDECTYLIGELRSRRPKVYAGADVVLPLDHPEFDTARPSVHHKYPHRDVNPCLVDLNSSRSRSCLMGPSALSVMTVGPDPS